MWYFEEWVCVYLFCFFVFSLDYVIVMIVVYCDMLIGVLYVDFCVLVIVIVLFGVVDGCLGDIVVGRVL